MTPENCYQIAQEKKINYKWETKKQNVTNYQELATLGKGIYDVHYAIFKTFFVGLEFGE